MFVWFYFSFWHELSLYLITLWPAIGHKDKKTAKQIQIQAQILNIMMYKTANPRFQCIKIHWSRGDQAELRLHVPAKQIAELVVYILNPAYVQYDDVFQYTRSFIPSCLILSKSSCMFSYRPWKKGRIENIATIKMWQHNLWENFVSAHRRHLISIFN